MRKHGWLWNVWWILGLGLLLSWPATTLAQWGAIGTGIDAARRATQQREATPSRPEAGPHNVADEATGGAGSRTPVTYRNRVRNFSYTIPAGWRLESGDPTGERVVFMRPGTTCSFNFHFTQLVPSFPRKASVDASYKQAKEEMSIGKYIAVKRRDQGGKNGVIGWETIESSKGSGGFQRIQWQCYDAQNFYYSFMTGVDPRQFSTHRAEMQAIINSITFGR